MTSKPDSAASKDLHPGPEVFLWLRPLADDVAWHTRLKAALKVLLRRFRFKARAFTDLDQLPPNAQEFEPDR
jgi:hypothetical protein